MTACARSSKSPTTSRLRRHAAGRVARAPGRLPRTPATAPPSVDQLVDAVAEAQRTPGRRPPRRGPGATNGSTTPGPVPQVTWKRGTELPCPSRRAAAALGPADDREEPHAPLAQPGPLLPGGELDVGARPAARPSGPRRRGRSRPCPASPARPARRESCTPMRRCSGESTRNSPPNDQNAWPPRLAARSWSTSTTRLPAATSSAVATRPARPAPTTMTSVCTRGPPGRRPYGASTYPCRLPAGRGAPRAGPAAPQGAQPPPLAAPPTMGPPCRTSPRHRSAPAPPGGGGPGVRRASSP